MTASGQRYTAVAIALHWVIALSILFMIGLGWVMGDLNRNDPMHEPLFALHKSLGLTILLLSIARIAWRLMNKPPAEPSTPGWQAKLAAFVHVSFYVLIIVMPLTGWLYSSLSRPGGTQFWGLPWADLPGSAQLSDEARRSAGPAVETIHSKLAWVIIVLLGLHIAGALKHQFVDRDGLLARMAPGLFGRTDGPPAKGRGLIYALGALGVALLAGLMIGALGVGGPASAAPEPQKAQAAASTSDAPRWKVDPARSSIAWKGVYTGRTFLGAFREWTADIQFSADRPEATRVKVTINTASARNTDEAGVSQPYFDDSLKETDWLSVRKFPTALFEIAGGARSLGGGKYEADGVLTIKSAQFPIKLPFEVKMEGAKAVMHGEATVQRLAMKIGGATLAAGKSPAGPDDPEWVGDDIKIIVDVVAERS